MFEGEGRPGNAHVVIGDSNDPYLPVFVAFCAANATDWANYYSSHFLPFSFRCVLDVAHAFDMQAIVRACPRRVLLNAPRCYATATANPVHVVSHTSTSSGAAIPLSNVEAQWEKLTPEEQVTVHQQLEELQKKDWKELSIDEKKAGKSIMTMSHPLSLRKPYYC